jgi:lysophospholipase L1-like esterase
MNHKSILFGVLCALAMGMSAEAQQEGGAQSAPQRPDGMLRALETGDRVVFLGNGFFERAYYYGHIESALTLRWPDAKVSFRNIGWTGDTVGGLARSGGRRGAIFGTAEEGFQVLVDHVASLDPTHLFIAYGFNESFAGRAGIAQFAGRLDRLLAAVAKEGREIVLLSPLPVEHGFGAPVAYVDERNDLLRAYAKVIQEKARGADCRYVDLFDTLLKQTAAFSEDGIHPTSEGYARIADTVLRVLTGSESLSYRSTPEHEGLRQAIVKKNTLFFHRWRPRNDAFVYGERNDEQPIANAEPVLFEPFIVEQEEIIWGLLKSASSTPSAGR